MKFWLQKECLEKIVTINMNRSIDCLTVGSKWPVDGMGEKKRFLGTFTLNKFDVAKWVDYISLAIGSLWCHSCICTFKLFRFTRRRCTRTSKRRSPERMKRSRRRPTRRRCLRVSSAPRSSNGSLRSKNISGRVLQVYITRYHFEKY